MAGRVRPNAFEALIVDMERRLRLLEQNQRSITIAGKVRLYVEETSGGHKIMALNLQSGGPAVQIGPTIT